MDVAITGIGAISAAGADLAGNLHTFEHGKPSAGGVSVFPTSLSYPVTFKAGNIAPGDTKHYQVWYRNPTASPCATEANTTNGISITWEP